MILLSVLTLILLATLHLYHHGRFGHTIDTPISFELNDRNPLAWVLIASVCVMIIVFAVRLFRQRQTIRAAVLLVIGLILLGVTAINPGSPTHDALFWLTMLLTFDWFFVTASDYGLHALKFGAIVCFVAAPVLFVMCSPGISERVIILGFLVGANVLYKICGRAPIESIDNCGGATGGPSLLSVIL